MCLRMACVLPLLQPQQKAILPSAIIIVHFKKPFGKMDKDFSSLPRERKLIKLPRLVSFNDLLLLKLQSWEKILANFNKVFLKNIGCASVLHTYPLQPWRGHEAIGSQQNGTGQGDSRWVSDLGQMPEDQSVTWSISQERTQSSFFIGTNNSQSGQADPQLQMTAARRPPFFAALTAPGTKRPNSTVFACLLIVLNGASFRKMCIGFQPVQLQTDQQDH